MVRGKTTNTNLPILYPSNHTTQQYRTRSANLLFIRNKSCRPSLLYKLITDCSEVNKFLISIRFCFKHPRTCFFANAWFYAYSLLHLMIHQPNVHFHQVFVFFRFLKIDTLSIFFSSPVSLLNLASYPAECSANY